MRFIGLFLMLVGFAGFLVGVRFAVSGVWPWRFGEPFDLLVFSAAFACFGLVILLRAGRHPRGMLLRDMAELQHFPGNAERQVAVDEVVVELRKAREGRPKLVVAIAILSSVVTVPLYLLLRWSMSHIMPPFLAKVLACIAVVAVLLGPTLASIRRSGPRLLRQKLLERGVPVCMKCGYVLRGCPGPNCPECGAPFDERVIALLGAS